MSNVWIEDPDTGDIYQDRIDSKGRTVRAWRKYPKEASRAESSSTPRARRGSEYDRPTDESSSRRQREKSTGRGPIRGDRRPSYTESDRRQPYTEDNGRYADEPGEAYFDSSRQTSTSYQPRDDFEQPSSPSRQFSSAQPRHLSPRPFDPGTGESLAESLDALHVSDAYYTHSPIVAPATRDWQPSTVSSRLEETTFLSSDRNTSQQVYSSHDYHDQQPLSVAETQQQEPNRLVKGTPGPSERIDKSYKVRNRDYKEFFRIGRVFSTLWTDALGNNAGKVDPTFVSEILYGERVYSKIRRFIVVREGERSVSCLPVTSYANEGIRKSGIRLDEHGFIYSRNKPKKVEGMCSRPLKLSLASGAAHLKDPSLVNYGKVYNVETNVKVKNVGTLDIDSEAILLHYFRKIYSGIEDPGGAGITPRASEAVLFGVGAALNSYPATVPPASYMPATTSGSGFASASTMSGYPPAPSTVYAAPSDFGARAGSSASYPPSSQHESSYSMSYPPPASNTYGMDSAAYSGPSPYATPSMHSQTRYAGAPVTASPAGLTYSSENMMDPGRRSSTLYYPASTRASYYEPPQGSTPLPPPNPGYSSSGYYQEPLSNYPPTSAGSDYYAQPGVGFAQPAEQYTPQGGYSTNPPYSEPAPPSNAVYDDDDIDLGNLESARQQARKRRESRPDRRRPPAR